MSSARFVLIREDDLEAVTEALDAVRSLHLHLKELEQALGQLRGSGSIEIDPKTLGVESVEPEVTESARRVYRIGRARGQHSYSDVAWKEIEEPEFTLDEAWDQLEPIIINKSSRGRDSLRRALDRDERFTRVNRDDDTDIWFRKVDTDQIEIEET